MSKKGSSYGGGYSKKDAAKGTRSTRSQVDRAWHDARNDGAREGGRFSPGDRGEKGGTKNRR